MKKICIGILSLASVISVSCQNSDTPKTAKTIAAVEKEIAPGIKQLPNKQVCMINNKFTGKDQIPVVVNGKTYYGCCEGCVTTLKTSESSRFAVDALTKEKVDKATAIIVLKPGSKDDVLYFNSEANAIEYAKR